MHNFQNFQTISVSLQVWALSEQNIVTRLFEKDSVVRQSQVRLHYTFLT